MHTSTWKHTERALAKKLNGTRTGPQGKAIEDVTTDWLTVESKHRKELPAWLKAAIAQVVNAAAKKPGYLGIVVLHEAGKRHDNDLVVVRFGDFVEWFGDVKVEELTE